MNLEEVMLNKCIEHFTSLNGESDSFRNSEKYGELPSGLSMVFCDAVRRTEHFYKKFLRNVGYMKMRFLQRRALTRK